MNWLDHIKSLVVDPHDVDLADRTYYFPFFSDAALLRRSIEEIGILNPPLLQEHPNGRMIPILGRRRLKVACDLGMEQVEVKIAAADMPETAGFMLAFWDNLGHRNFDQACTVVVVKRLLELFPRNVVAKEFLPALGIPSMGPRLERLRAIAGLEDTVLEALASGRIQEKTAVILAQLSVDDRKAVLELLESLKMNANKTAEVISHLFDLSVFHNKPITGFLRDRDVVSIVQNHEIPIPERAARFRDLIRSWKFPELALKEREFLEWRRGLPASEKVCVRPAPAFESEELTVEIRVDSREKAEKILKKV